MHARAQVVLYASHTAKKDWSAGGFDSLRNVISPQGLERPRWMMWYTSILQVVCVFFFVYLCFNFVITIILDTYFAMRKQQDQRADVTEDTFSGWAMVCWLPILVLCYQALRANVVCCWEANKIPFIQMRDESSSDRIISY
jgi:hypothetical protein